LAALASRARHCCPGVSRTCLPSVCGHSLEDIASNQRSRLGSVTSNAGEPHDLNARTPAHTTATTTERRDNGVRGIFQAVCDSSVFSGLLMPAWVGGPAAMGLVWNRSGCAQ